MEDKLTGAIEGLFDIEGHLFSTRSADAHKAIDRRTGALVTLWMLRHPLAQSSSAVERFVYRCQVLQGMPTLGNQILRFGVDQSGIAFAVLSPVDGDIITKGAPDIREAERRFSQCVRIVEELHTYDIVCGDLCASSFLVGREGQIRFVGMMGSFDSEAAQTAMLPPMETLHFVAPEQKTGGGLEKASDVFSLGVLGYLLFTGRYPFGEAPPIFTGAADTAKVPLPSSVNPAAPKWADEVLIRCLANVPSQRISTAGQLRQLVEDSRTVRSGAHLAPVTRSGSAQSVSGAIHIDSKDEDSRPQSPPSPPSGSTVRRRVTVAIFAVILGMVLVVSVNRFTSKGRTQPPSVLSLHQDAARSEDLRRAIAALRDTDTSVQEREQHIRAIIASDDPIAHAVLVGSALDATNADIRNLSEKAIIERARRLGLMRSSDEVRTWLGTLAQGRTLPSAYEPLLRALDTTLPDEARFSALRQAYATSPDMALRVATALALDRGDPEAFRPVLEPLVGDSLRLDETAPYSVAALILASPDLSQRFGPDVLRLPESIPSSNVMWVLERLAQRNDINVRAVANLALEGGEIKGASVELLRLIKERGDLPPEVLTALVRTVRGSLTQDDLGGVGRWHDLRAERVLLVVCAEAPSRELRTSALEMLAGRSLSVVPAIGLVDWIRARAWDERARFAEAVGVLGLGELMDSARIDRALSAFDDFAKDGRLMGVLLSTEVPVLTRAVLSRFGKHLSLGRLIGVLENSDSESRIIAVKALGAVNDIGALRLIIDHYEAETDPNVKAAYRETFWVIRQREEGRQ